MNLSKPFTKLKRSYKNFDEFLAHKRAYWFKGIYPCPECWGNTRIYDPDDPPCPVEGNKMRSRIKCPTCKGTGESSKQELLKVYRKAVDRDNHILQEWKRNENMRITILGKLTQEEINFLGKISNLNWW